jgi:hypothetical protein
VTALNARTSIMTLPSGRFRPGYDPRPTL